MTIQERIESTTHAALAKSVRCTPQYITMVLGGHRQPRADKLSSLASALGVSMDELHAFLRERVDTRRSRS